MKEIIYSGNTPHNYLQLEINNYLNSRENVQINRGDDDNLVYKAYENDNNLIQNKNDD